MLVPLEPEHISCRKVSPGRGCQTQVNFPAPALGPYSAPLLFNTDDSAQRCRQAHSTLLLNLGSILCKLHPALLKVLAVTAETNCCWFSPSWKEKEISASHSCETTSENALCWHALRDRQIHLLVCILTNVNMWLHVALVLINSASRLPAWAPVNIYPTIKGEA